MGESGGRRAPLSPGSQAALHAIRARPDAKGPDTSGGRTGKNDRDGQKGRGPGGGGGERGRAGERGEGLLGLEKGTDSCLSNQGAVAVARMHDKNWKYGLKNR